MLDYVVEWVCFIWVWVDLVEMEVEEKWCVLIVVE